MSGLLACPFCGELDAQIIEGSTFRWRLVKCSGCGAQGPDVRIQTTGRGSPSDWEKKAALAAGEQWNQRQPNDHATTLRHAICQTLNEHGHLADGEVCTLIALKRALRDVGTPWDGDEPPP